MEDYYEYIKQGNTAVRLCIWESSKIGRGFVKWHVQRYEDGFWVNCGDYTVTTLDTALANGRAFLQECFNVGRDKERESK